MKCSGPNMIHERANAASVQSSERKGKATIATPNVGKTLSIMRRCGCSCVIEHLARLSAYHASPPDAGVLLVRPRKVDTVAVRGENGVGLFRRIVGEANGFTAGHLTQIYVRGCAMVRHEDKRSTVRRQRSARLGTAIIG